MSLKEGIKRLSNEELLRDISYGREGFQEGIFEIYLKEAETRALDINTESFRQAKAVIQADESKARGRMLVLYSIVFLGPLSFLPGIALLKLDPYGKPRYGTVYRFIGGVGILAAIVSWVFIFLNLF